MEVEGGREQLSQMEGEGGREQLSQMEEEGGRERDQVKAEVERERKQFVEQLSSTATTSDTTSVSRVRNYRG